MKILFSDSEEDIDKYYIKKKERLFEDVVITEEIKSGLYKRLDSFIKFELVAHKKKPGGSEEFDRSENGPLYGLKGIPFKLLNKPPINVTLNPQLPKIVNYAHKNTYDYESELEEEREKQFKESEISVDKIEEDSKIPWGYNISDFKKRRYRRHKSQKKRIIEASIKAGVMKERKPKITKFKKFIPDPVYERDGYGNYVLQNGMGKSGGYNKGRFNNKFKKNNFGNKRPFNKGNNKF